VGSLRFLLSSHSDFHILNETKFSYTLDKEAAKPPAPAPGEALVKWEAVAICGSDIPLWKWDATGQAIAELPFIPGHECCGTVVALGEGEEEAKVAYRGSESGTFSVGDRVCAETHIPCQKCYQCTHEREDICAGKCLLLGLNSMSPPVLALC
jgi:threonine 3-dehydrogenase